MLSMSMIKRCLGAFMLVLLIAQIGAVPSHADPSGEQTLQALQAAQVPARDRVDLAKRVLGITSIPAPPTVPVAYQLGDKQVFNAVNLDTATLNSPEATLVYATPHVYMWFQSDYEPNLDKVKTSADYLENTIYPTVHRYFGSEASPGIDGDVHLYVINVRKLGRNVAGYYEGDSELPKAVAPNSNEHQLFFMNLDTMAKSLGTPYYAAVLAHEFQHMVHANVDPNEAVWMDEGMSELSASLAVPEGFSYSFAADFMNRPATQLNDWSNINSSTAHYGASFLFMRYFLQRFGEEALRQLEHSPLDGLDSIADILRQIKAIDVVSGQTMTVDDLFADWIAANYLKQRGDTRFGYPSITDELPTPTTSAAVIGAPQAINLTQWGTVYLSLPTTPGSYTLHIEGEPTVKVLPTTSTNGQMFWWSNRGDQYDTRLTRAFDLTGLSKATLNFRTWFATEEDWDFAYVMISVDGGATWKTLPLPAGTAGADGNNYYGSAYTGNSGGANDERSAKWIDQSIDLTSYAGKQIMLRFEYITDEAVSEPGFAVDDISIPELGYSTNAETDDGGWQAEGWVRIDNTLPQRYLVQLITAGTQPTVQRLLSPSDAVTGDYQIEVGANAGAVVLSFSGMTEFTTEPAQLTYTLTKQ
ncbi:MAG: immune inhibitor A [Anaerolineae bacterium]|nr:immune inhibitor A [Anaerolineae bacterium]